MADFNDVLFDAIQKNTGDDIRPVVQPNDDKELLRAILSLLTTVVRKMVDEPEVAEITKPITEVVPLVSECR